MRAIEQRLRTLRRRFRLVRFFGGFLLVAVALAVVGATFLLVARLFDLTLTPTPLWALALIAPIAWGARRAATADVSDRTCAAHLDRRLGLGGLLLVGLERDLADWQPELARRLLRSDPAREPHVRFGRLAVHAAIALAILVGVLALPNREVQALERHPMLASELAELRERLETALEAGAIESEKAEDAMARIRKLEERLLDGEAVEWTDVDAMAEELVHEWTKKLGETEKARAALRSLADALRSEGASEERLDQLAKALEALGGLDGLTGGALAELPESLRDKLEQALGDHEGATLSPEDAKRLAEALEGLDAEDLAKLAEMLEGRATGKLEKWEGGDFLDPAELRLVREWLEPDEIPMPEGLEEALPCFGPEGGMGLSIEELRLLLAGRDPASSGITRGRGDAALDGSGGTKLDVQLEAKRLPPGRVPPRDWSVTGVSRAAPRADPVRDDAREGRDGDTGLGGAASGSRLAPRHRDVVRRFFDKPK